MQLQRSRERAFFVTLEGPEGCGKSTQVQLLAARLGSFGVRPVVAREPGGTPLGESIRQLLLHSRDFDPVPATDALLFNAARSQLVARVIEPALGRGEVVICDRFADSTLAYQGYGAGQPIEDLLALQRVAIGNLRPDLTVLVDIPVEQGLGRKQPDQITRFEERRDLEFHRRVRQGFLALARAEPDRWLVLDGQRTVDEIAADVFGAVAARLGLDEPPAGAGSRSGPGEPVRSSEPHGDSVRMDR
jgi:dTMP kinase